MARANIAADQAPAQEPSNSPRQMDITGRVNRPTAPVSIKCPLTGMFENQLDQRGFKMAAANAHLVQTILLLAMAGTVAYCWIRVLFPAATWISEPQDSNGKAP
jgi:hypothetical protein